MSIRILRHHIQLPILLLMWLDAAVAFVAPSLATGQWPVDSIHGSMNWLTNVVFSVLFLLASSAMGLYNQRLREQLLGLGLRFALVAAGVFAVMLLELQAFPSPRLSPARLAGALFITIAAALVVRFILTRVVSDGFLKTRVLVYGAGRQAQSIASLKRRSDRMGFVVVGYLPTESDSGGVLAPNLLDAGDDLYGFCESNEVDEIVVAVDDRRQAFPLA